MSIHKVNLRPVRDVLGQTVMPSLLVETKGKYHSGEVLNANAVEALIKEWLSKYHELPDEDQENNTGTGPNTNGVQYVDLGLPSGTLWATQPLMEPESTNLGWYFFGSVTSTETNIDPLCTDSINYQYTKYNSTDGLRELTLEDDAANVALGGDWRTPSPRALLELINNCEVLDQDEESITFKSKVNENTLQVPFYCMSRYVYQDALFTTQGNEEPLYPERRSATFVVLPCIENPNYSGGVFDSVQLFYQNNPILDRERPLFFTTLSDSTSEKAFYGSTWGQNSINLSGSWSGIDTIKLIMSKASNVTLLGPTDTISFMGTEYPISELDMPQGTILLSGSDAALQTEGEIITIIPSTPLVPINNYIMILSYTSENMNCFTVLNISIDNNLNQ